MKRRAVPTVTLIHNFGDYTEYQLNRACKICIALGRGRLILTEPPQG